MKNKEEILRKLFEHFFLDRSFYFEDSKIFIKTTINIHSRINSRRMNNVRVIDIYVNFPLSYVESKNLFSLLCSPIPIRIH
jgi:hypothetical protein